MGIILYLYISTGQDDIIDETLNFFRANVLFRNFDVRTSADRTLIYLTMFTVFCLVKCEKIEDKNAGTKVCIILPLFMNTNNEVIRYLIFCFIIYVWASLTLQPLEN
jgi:hypothetical protein